MSQRIALWTSAALSVAFALIVSVVLIGPSITTADQADERFAGQQTDSIDRGNWAQLDWFGQPVSDQQATMWRTAGAAGEPVAVSYDERDDDEHDGDHDDDHDDDHEHEHDEDDDD
ncbi:MAG TPA: hypothetical protein PKA95_00570 [Thermomicrobiales bacterium]|nr:hypothetical protein [Thermomicrobiales bacterium]